MCLAKLSQRQRCHVVWERGDDGFLPFSLICRAIRIATGLAVSVSEPPTDRVYAFVCYRLRWLCSGAGGIFNGHGRNADVLRIFPNDLSDTAHWVFGGERKVLGNSPVSWLPWHQKCLHSSSLARSPMLSGSSVETGCSVVRYCVLVLAGQEGSRKLTGQLVEVAPERFEPGQIANALRKLCRNKLFIRSVLRTGFDGAEKLLGNSLVSWFPPTSSQVRLARSPMLSGSSVETGCSFCQYCVLHSDGARKVLGNSLVSWLFRTFRTLRLVNFRQK